MVFIGRWKWEFWGWLFHSGRAASDLLGMTSLIPRSGTLGERQFAVVDEPDFAAVPGYRWSAMPWARTQYAKSMVFGQTVTPHQLIMRT